MDLGTIFGTPFLNVGQAGKFASVSVYTNPENAIDRSNTQFGRPSQEYCQAAETFW